MKKALGIFCLLIAVSAFTAVMNHSFLSEYNVTNTIRWTGLYGVMGIGVALVIITSGIDLSIGSVIALAGVCLPLLLIKYHWSPWAAFPVVIGLCAILGLIHGLLITKLKLQPFVVTLCGLLIYRHAARYIAEDATQGFGTGYEGLKSIVKSNVLTTPYFSIPTVFLILCAVAAIAAFFLHRTIWGRYLLALGRNEEAARYSGIQTDRIIILAYIICAAFAGLTGILMALYTNSVQPSNFGNGYELYAIAAAVLGGCSLRGGEGSMLGVVIGAALMRVLYNAINMLGIPTQLELAVIGGVIMIGVITDELVRRFASRRRAIETAIEAPAVAK